MNCGGNSSQCHPKSIQKQLKGIIVFKLHKYANIYFSRVTKLKVMFANAVLNTK